MVGWVEELVNAAEQQINIMQVRSPSQCAKLPDAPEYVSSWKRRLRCIADT